MKLEVNGVRCLQTMLDGGLLRELVPVIHIDADEAESLAKEESATPVGSMNLDERAVSPELGDHTDDKTLLTKLKYQDRSMIGWAIFLRNQSVFDYLLSLGVNPSICVDTQMNTCLHFTAKYGSASMVEKILSFQPTKFDKKDNSLGQGKYVIRLEAVNSRGFTPAMEAVSSGNQQTLQVLFRHKASARRCLRRCCWAFILASSRRQEKNEINMQTGRMGQDDVQYFSPSPDPLFTLWYEDKL